MGAYAAQLMNGFVLTTAATATRGEAKHVRIDAIDQRGAIFPAYAGTAQVSSTDAAASLPPTGPLAVGSRVDVVTWNTLGAQTLTVRDSETATLTASADVNVLAAPAFDLALSITDGGNFVAGAAGTLSLDVRNIGNLAASGDVSVAVQLPAELTLVSASGEGWACDGATCSRSDELAIDTSYPPITVAVTIASNAPTSVTTSANVTSIGDANAENDLASHTTPVAPANTTPPPGGGDDDGPGPGPGTGDGNTNSDDTSSSDGGCAATNPMAWTALAALAYCFRKRSDAS